MVQLMAGRAGSRAAYDAGVVTFESLTPGSYAVGIDRMGVRRTVDVPEKGAEIVLD